MARTTLYYLNLDFSDFPRQALAAVFSHLRAVGVFLFLCLILSSCVPAPVPRVIKIGLVAPFEGAYRSTGYDAVYAARLAVREINAVSVPNGWALELVAYDDRAESDLAQSSARNLVTDPGVLAVIGHYAGETTAAASPVYSEAELPLLIIGEGPESPTNWHMTPLPHHQVEIILKSITEPMTRAVVWGEGDLASELSQQLTSQNVQVLASSLKQVSTTPVFIFSTLPALETAEHLRIWSEQGWRGNLVGTNGLYAESFVRLSGKWRDQACFITPYPAPNDISGIDHWAKAYANTGPHVPEPGSLALPTYEAVYVLAEAIAELHKAGTPFSRQRLNGALAQTQRTGKLGVISWDINGYWYNAPLYQYCWEDTLQLMQSYHPTEMQ